MAKTNKRINVEEIERDEESPSHKKRREIQYQLRNLLSEPSQEDDDFYDIDTFEKIRPKYTKR